MPNSSKQTMGLYVASTGYAIPIAAQAISQPTFLQCELNKFTVFNPQSNRDPSGLNARCTSRWTHPAMQLLEEKCCTVNMTTGTAKPKRTVK
jgi:hypothetical protein